MRRYANPGNNGSKPEFAEGWVSKGDPARSSSH
jgi:hypothetical protein